MDLKKAREYYPIDAHTHLFESDPEAGARLLARSQKAGIDKICLLSIGEMKYATQNTGLFTAKAKHPQHIYAFAGLDYSALATEVDHRHTFPFGQQIARLYAMGADGLKMLNGKPNFRKEAGVALDSPIYDGLFNTLEESQIPLLWHVNDPEEFWNTHPNQAPEWATRAGWTYDDSFPTYEQIQQETERVLAAHPKLKVIFAHFYFMSANLPRLAQLLEQFPNMHVDITPGIEMFHNFSANIEKAQEFFLKYQDRIVFGTDLTEKSPMGLTETVRKCLETDDTWHITTEPNLFWPDHRSTLRGLHLPADVLKKIGGENFFRLVAKEPRPLDKEAVAAEVARLSLIAEETGETKQGAQLSADDWLRQIMG